MHGDHYKPHYSLRTEDGAQMTTSQHTHTHTLYRPLSALMPRIKPLSPQRPTNMENRASTASESQSHRNLQGSTLPRCNKNTEEPVDCLKLVVTAPQMWRRRSYRGKRRRKEGWRTLPVHRGAEATWGPWVAMFYVVGHSNALWIETRDVLR